MRSFRFSVSESALLIASTQAFANPAPAVESFLSCASNGRACRWNNLRDGGLESCWIPGSRKGIMAEIALAPRGKIMKKASPQKLRWLGIIVLLLSTVGANAATADLEAEYAKAEKMCETQAAAMGASAYIGFQMRLPDDRKDLKDKVIKMDAAKLCKCDFDTSKAEYGLELAASLHSNYGIRGDSIPAPTTDKEKHERRLKHFHVMTKCVEQTP